MGKVRAEDDDELVLVGWGVDTEDLDGFLGRAAEIGFQILIAWATDSALLERITHTARKHRIRVFASFTPTTQFAEEWRKRYPGRDVPWQVMNDQEKAAWSFGSAGMNRALIPYQWGGEPVMENEVLLVERIACFNNRDVKDLFFSMIDGVAAVPGIEGIALDGFGYQNYRRCRCEQCSRLLSEFRDQHPEIDSNLVETVYFRGLLVNTVNELAAYARRLRPTIKISIHIWPVFLPDPLYGNRLDIDYCGQTAAWYTRWPVEKIARYSRVVVEQAKSYHPKQVGVGMIGYYDRPGEFPVKDAACVEAELATMIANGCRRIQVCGTGDVIRNKEIAGVFARYFAPTAKPLT